jgi:hypothetical protein
MSSTTAGRLVANASKDFVVEIFEHQSLGSQIISALAATGREEKRDCPLKAPLVVAFVILMNLRRSVSLVTLLDEVFGLLRHRVGAIPLRAVTSEAMCHARRRLGPEPLRVLFEQRAARVRPVGTFHGLRPVIFDGVSFKVPDTKANEVAFGRPGVSRGRAGFPQMVAMILMDAESRQVNDVAFGRRTDSERDLCSRLIHRLGHGDLVLHDQGLAGAWLLEEFLKQGCRFLVRAPLKWTPRIIQRFADGDYLVRIQVKYSVPEAKRGANEGRATRIIELELRMIEYRIGKRQRVRLLTDLTDPIAFPARELALTYHTRWDVEIGLDEIKTHLAAVTHGIQKTTFRSKTPEGVIQEAYGLLVAYNIIRELMVNAGHAHRIPHLEISFVESLETIRRAMPTFQSVPTWRQERTISILLEDIARCRLTRPRRPRIYPRVVKVKMTNFAQKRRRHRGRPNPAARDLRITRRYRPARRGA